MRTSHLLALVAGGIVPASGDSALQKQLADRLLTGMPLPIRSLFSLLVWILWGVAGVSRRGAADRQQGAGRWVDWALARPTSPFYSLAQWFKAVACLIVLGDPAARRQLYEQSPGLPLATPRLVEEPPVPNEADLVADYVVVGSGPAGATLARTLAQAGASVLILEDGPAMPAAWMASNTAELLAKRFRNGGTLTTLGRGPMPVLQGRGVGGSSVINSAISWRAPDDVLAAWHTDFALRDALPSERWERAFASIEAALGMQATESGVMGHSSTLMAQGARALGIVGGPTRRYTSGCEGLGRCMEGCPRGHKLSMDVTFLPQAVAAGARLLANCSVSAVEFEGRRAVGVRARLGGRGRQIRARQAVVLAASAIQTPILLRRSGIHHPLLGRRFQAHPGASVAAVFDTPVRSGAAATQGYDSIHFRQSGRIKLESLTLPDELMATRFGGSGPGFSQALEEMPNTALWALLVRAKAHGRVGGGLALPLVHYELGEDDAQNLGRGLYTLCEMFLAAGARAVLPGVAGFKARLTHPDDLRGLAEAAGQRGRAATIASHLFGTAVMGGRQEGSVCNPWGAVHGSDGLYVADSSLFPTNLGVNPQHTIMAVAQHVAWGLLERPPQK